MVNYSYLADGTKESSLKDLRRQPINLVDLDEELRHTITTLEKSKIVYHIIPTRYRPKGKKGNAYYALTKEIFFDPDKETNNEGEVRPPAAGLAHELGHAYNDETGQRVKYKHGEAEAGDFEEGEKGNREESRPIYLENIVRRRYKFKPRNYDYYKIYSNNR